MDDHEILSLYDWHDGDCFRCARRDTPTTLVAVIEKPRGDGQEVRACQPCVLDLEGMRRAAAEHAGRPYEPGRLAEGEDE